MLLLLAAVASLAVVACLSPQYPPYGFPLDRLMLVKPYTRWSNKFSPLGAVMTTMTEIRLTPDMKGTNGAIWSKSPIDLGAFSVEVRLRLSAQSTSMVADGVGVWFTEQTSFGEAYGIANRFIGFGVVLDTYDNTNSFLAPMLSLLASNGTMPINNEKNGEEHRLGTCRPGAVSSLVREGFDRNARETIILHIEYVPGKMVVFYRSEDGVDWQHCFTQQNLFIPPTFYLGVSASTGDISAHHDLISLKVYELPVDIKLAQRSSMHFEPKVPSEPVVESKNERQVLTVLFFAVAFLAVAGGLAIIIRPQILPGKQAAIDRQKRFY